MGNVLTSIDESLKDIIGADFKFPLKADGQGRLATLEGLDNLSQAIVCLLETSPGETLYHREIGIGIRRYVHQLTSRIEKIAPVEIEGGIMKHEKRVKSVRVTVTKDDENRVAYIKVVYKPVGHAIEGIVTIPIVESGSFA
jgi:phage baseplate assembly protein W